MSNPRLWLKSAREAAGFKTQREFAERIGASEPVVSQWENGHRTPSYVKILAIVELLGPEIHQQFAAEVRHTRSLATDLPEEVA
jgi:transcriptional regulator with XRE-family HTH domain